jgi:hypothetical protein
MGIVCIAVLSSTGWAQSVPLTFTVQPGQEVRRVFQIHTVVQETAADGTIRRREAGTLGHVRELVLSESDGRYVVYLTVDSLVLRAREADQAWRESHPTNVHPWVQLEVDSCLRTQRLGGTESESPILLPLLTGLPGLVLPEQPIGPGQVWRQELELSAAAATTGAGGAAGNVRLPMTVSFSVDSVVQRERDHLVYLAVDGQGTPSRVRRADGRTLEYGATVAGALVWSSGWSRFVSAAIRTVVTIGVREDRGSSGVVIRTTLRQAIRPLP